jgi:hypothetical protein
MTMRTVFKGSQRDSLVTSCENCNEPLGFVIGLEVSGQLSYCHLQCDFATRSLIF